MPSQDHPHPPKIKRYIEIDFPEATSRKIRNITSSPRRLPLLATRNITPDMHLSSSLHPSHTSPHQNSSTDVPTSLKSPIYCILPLDLASDATKDLQEHILPMLDPQIPTLFLAECVFCYMSPEASSSVVKWFGETFERSAGIVYEMLGVQ